MKRRGLETASVFTDYGEVWRKNCKTENQLICKLKNSYEK